MDGPTQSHSIHGYALHMFCVVKITAYIMFIYENACKHKQWYYRHGEANQIQTVTSK